MQLNMAAIREWVTEAGQIALHYFGAVDAEWKDSASPVTIADREIETMLTAHLRAAYPDHGIIGEEFGAQDVGRDFVWLVDPIDGTRAFVEGLPSWSVSLALLHQRQPVFGLVYIPLYDDWTYTDGDDVIHSTPSQPRRVITGCLRRAWEPGSYIMWRSDADAVYDLQFPRRISMGTSASHLAYTARGSALAAIVHDSFAWDIAAGAAFLARQGGEIRFHSGEVLDFGQLDLTQRITGLYAAGDPAVIERLLPLVMPRADLIELPAW